jgi:hypothetical protein
MVPRGNHLPLGDQKSVSGDAEGGVMVKAAPTARFKMPEPDLLLEFLIIALDASAQLGDIDQARKADLFRKRGEPVFDRLPLTLGPFDQQPFLRRALR